MADVIEADTIREPSQPPGTSARIEVVFDVSVGPADGRDGVALDVGVVDDPPRPPATISTRIISPRTLIRSRRRQAWGEARSDISSAPGGKCDFWITLCMLASGPRPAW